MKPLVLHAFDLDNTKPTSAEDVRALLVGGGTTHAQLLKEFESADWNDGEQVVLYKVTVECVGVRTIRKRVSLSLVAPE
jgi:hypothetical protein